jgi:molybdopterin converting factor subunit 1
VFNKKNRMTVKILTFGIARDIVGSSTFETQINEGSTVADLKNALLERYPRFGTLASLMIAVNAEYGNEATVLSERDEIAIIPPVAGG